MNVILVEALLLSNDRPASRSVGVDCLVCWLSGHAWSFILICYIHVDKQDRICHRSIVEADEVSGDRNAGSAVERLRNVGIVNVDSLLTGTLSRHSSCCVSCDLVCGKRDRDREMPIAEIEAPQVCGRFCFRSRKNVVE